MTSRTWRSALAAAAGFSAAFVLLTLWVRFHGPIAGDARLQTLATDHPATNQDLFDFYNLFSVVGSPFVVVATALVSAVVLLHNVGLREAVLVLLAPAGTVLESPLAHLIGPTDAATALGGDLAGYPSGHCLFAASTFGLWGLLAGRDRRFEIVAICGVLILLMGITRITLRAHLLDEVLAGYLLGAAWLCLLIGVADRFTASS